MTSIPRTCQQCNTAFQADAREVKRGNAKFCSRTCCGKYRSTHISAKEPNVTCALCGTAFFATNTRQKLSKSGLYFCSRAHKDEAQRLDGLVEIHPEHYGRGKTPSYRQKAFAFLPNKCRVCGYNKYLNVLQVNHIDKDRSNSALENLEILCPTHHVEFHFLDNSGIFTRHRRKNEI